jgi:hypothetical protein
MPSGGTPVTVFSAARIGQNPRYSEGLFHVEESRLTRGHERGRRPCVFAFGCGVRAIEGDVSAVECVGRLWTFVPIAGLSSVLDHGDGVRRLRVSAVETAAVAG